MGSKYVLGPEFWQGLRDGLPVMLAVTFFGALFGATGVSNGLTFWQTVGASASAFAGASQFVFLDLYNQQVPVWSVLLAVFAVNFRHVLYSASGSKIWYWLQRLRASVGTLLHMGSRTLPSPSLIYA